MLWPRRGSGGASDGERRRTGAASGKRLGVFLIVLVRERAERPGRGSLAFSLWGGTPDLTQVPYVRFVFIFLCSNNVRLDDTFAFIGGHCSSISESVSQCSVPYEEGTPPSWTLRQGGRRCGPGPPSPVIGCCCTPTRGGGIGTCCRRVRAALTDAT